MTKPPEDQFLDQIIERFYRLMHVRQENNYDALRFSQDGFDRSALLDVDWHTANLRLLYSDYKSFFNSYSLLADQTSRDIFIELVLYYILGGWHVRLSTNNDFYWKVINNLPGIPNTPSRFASFKSTVGQLRHYIGIPFNGESISIDCTPQDIAWAFFFKQYFLERGRCSVQPRPGDYVVDVGACLGNTSLAFATATTDTGHVYAFDPVGSHVDIIRHNLAQNSKLANRISIFPYALGSRGNNLPGPLPMVDIADPGFTLNQSAIIDRIPVRTIDELVESGDLERVDFIKMDIEGYETEALLGAEKSIRRYKPRLAICIYHKFSDLFEIPLLINRLNPGYKFHIGHYTIHTEETVLYATVE